MSKEAKMTRRLWRAVNVDMPKPVSLRAFARTMQRHDPRVRVWAGRKGIVKEGAK